MRSALLFIQIYKVTFYKKKNGTSNNRTLIF
nr:MAG TPA: hypothetical protein [Caudoviricetes sp.]